MSAAPIPQGGMAAEIVRIVQQLRNDANGEAADLIELLTDGGIAAEQDAIDHAAALAASEARVEHWEMVAMMRDRELADQIHRAELAEQSLAEAAKDAARWQCLTRLDVDDYISLVTYTSPENLAVAIDALLSTPELPGPQQTPQG